MLSWKRTFSIGLILIMLASAVVVFSGAEADPTRASNPTLSNASITPSTGYTDTSFNFTVWYTDFDGDAPTSVDLIIGSTLYNMTENRGANWSYSRGVEFFYTTNLSAGTHNYNFSTQNGLMESAKLPTIGTYNISVQSRSQGPQLYNSTYSPVRPYDHTGVNFSVMYNHPNGTAPMYVNMIVHDVTMAQNTTYNMTISGSNYTSGVTCTRFLQLNSGYYYYMFTARVSQNVAVNLPLTGAYTLYVASSGTQNNAPDLSGAGMSPGNPDAGENTTFWVTYMDADGDVPQYVILRYYPVNGSSYPVSVNTTVGAGNVTLGVNCSITLNAPANGTYYYYFITLDMRGAQDTTSSYAFNVGNGSSPPSRNPYLSRGMHSPQSPTINDTINFTVDYIDPSDLPLPDYVRLYLFPDGGSPINYTMAPTYANGSRQMVYYYSLSLLNNSYWYYFTAAIGNYTFSYPTDRSLLVTVANQSTPPPPTDTAPVLSNGAHSPTRPTSGSNITFSVRYTDRNGDAPRFIKLHYYMRIGLPNPAISMNWTGTNYAYGVTATYVLTLTTGNYSYYFTTSSNNTNVSYPSGGLFFNLTVGSGTSPPQQQNRAPTLTSPRLSTTSPVANQTIWFYITYTDADNDAPSYVKLHLLGGSGTNYLNFSMSVPRGTYSNGVTCTYSISLLAGTYYYYFTAASTNHTVTYPTSGTLSFTVSSRSQPPPGGNRSNIGARIVYDKDDASIDVTDQEEGFTVSLGETGEDFFEIDVTSESGEDRVIVIDLDPEMFDVNSPEDIVVKVDGKEIPYQYVSDPANWEGDEPAYYLQYTEAGAVLYVLLPKADTHTITAKVPDAVDDQNENHWYYVIAVILVLVIAAAIVISLLTMAQKKRIQEYYEDFDTGVRDNRIASGKLIDEDDIDWEDLIESEE